jgi:5,5'-dehydrodivanillate O-demethylase oxygenase subunit
MVTIATRPDDGQKRDDSADFVHTGPDTLAGRYMRMFWHPVHLAQELKPAHAVPIRIMSEDFTLYRGESGTAYAVGFRCAHRGTQLSTGWVEGDCIRCFYHGWKYDGAGQCVEQPAESPSFSSKVKIRSYPTEEYLGLIFVYLGEGEAPPLPRYPELAEEGILETTLYLRYCNYFNSLDNGIDEVHVAFTHSRSGFTSYGLNQDLPKIEAEETEYGIVQYGTRSDGVVRVTHQLMPNILYIKGSPANSESGWRDAFAWRVPIDDVSHKSFNVALVHVKGDAAHRYREQQERRLARIASLSSAHELAAAVLAGKVRIQDIEDRPDIVNIQDHVAQEGQGAIADREHERLGRSDVAVILLRKIWERELRALAEGQAVKKWTRAEQLMATTGLKG